MAADDGRLKSALLRPSRDDEPVPAPVDDAVAEAGRRLRAIVDEHGPDSVALYVSGQMSIEAQYLANKLAKGFLRTVHIESNSRLCMASAGTGFKQSLGADGPPGSYTDFDCAELFFVIGSNMADCHPILFLRMADRMKAGAKLIVVDPRRTATAQRADLYLQIKPGTDLALLNGLLHLLVENGDIDADFIAEHTEGWADMPAFLADYPPRPGRRHHRHPRGRHPHRGTDDRRRGGVDELLDDGAEPEHPRHLEHQRDLQPPPRHRRDLPSRQRPDVADRPAQRDGWPRNGLHGAGTARPAFGGIGGRPRLRREAVGPARRERSATTSVPAPSPCSNNSPQATSRRAGSSAPIPLPPWRIGSTVIAGLEAAELVITQDAYRVDRDEPLRRHRVARRAVGGGRRRDGQLRAQPHAACRRPSRPPEQARPDWQLICQVAAHLGFGEHFDFSSSEQVFDEIRRFSNPQTGYDLRGVSYSRLRQTPLQWPCPPDDDGDRHPIRYLNDGVSQDLFVDADGHRPRLAFPTPSRRAVFHARPHMDPRRAARRRFPVGAQHRPAAASVAHHDQDRQGRQTQQARQRTVRRTASLRRGRDGHRRRPTGRAHVAPRSRRDASRR